MSGYVHGKTTILQAPGAQRRHWDKARMQDAQIKRCTTCGCWTWRGKCTVPHEVLAEGEAA